MKSRDAARGSDCLRQAPLSLSPNDGLSSHRNKRMNLLYYVRVEAN